MHKIMWKQDRKRGTENIRLNSPIQGVEKKLERNR